MNGKITTNERQVLGLLSDSSLTSLADLSARLGGRSPEGISRTTASLVRKGLAVRGKLPGGKVGYRATC
jgi:predicted transcriptional regulator